MNTFLLLKVVYILHPSRFLSTPGVSLGAERTSHPVIPKANLRHRKLTSQPIS